MIPEGLTQPELQLPFEVGDVWSYTSGPHGGWDSGSAWAALDFAPPGEALGCFPQRILGCRFRFGGRLSIPRMVQLFRI